MQCSISLKLKLKTQLNNGTAGQSGQWDELQCSGNEQRRMHFFALSAELKFKVTHYNEHSIQLSWSTDILLYLNWSRGETGKDSLTRTMKNAFFALSAQLQSIQMKIFCAINSTVQRPVHFCTRRTITIQMVQTTVCAAAPLQVIYLKSAFCTFYTVLGAFIKCLFICRVRIAAAAKVQCGGKFAACCKFHTAHAQIVNIAEHNKI